MTAFPKTQRDVITLTIDEDGDLIFLQTDSADIFMELGTTVTKRASHVEPGSRYDRWFFHLLRFLFGDKGRVPEWTRTWNVLWRVNAGPVGGPILRIRDVRDDIDFAKYPQYGDQIAYWGYRQDAIDAEIIFLNKFFAERTI